MRDTLAVALMCPLDGMQVIVRSLESSGVAYVKLACGHTLMGE